MRHHDIRQYAQQISLQDVRNTSRVYCQVRQQPRRLYHDLLVSLNLEDVDEEVGNLLLSDNIVLDL